MRRLVFGALLAGLSLACRDAFQPGDAPAFSSEASERAHLDLREERASLIAAGNALAADIGSQGVVAGLSGALAEDALWLSPRSNVAVGRTAILSFLTTHPIAPSAISWHVIAADVSNDGTQGFTWAEGSITLNLGAGPTQLPALFLIYWRRVAGEWKVAVMSANAGGPLAEPIPPGFGTPDTKHRRNFPNTEVTQQRAQLLSVDAAFSAASVSDGTGPAFAAYAAPNAIAVGGGQFVYGADAIGEAFTGGPDDLVSWVPRFSDVAPSGDLGFTVGDATFILPDVTFYTKYLTVWQKQNTGEWKFVADFGSSRPAP